MFIIYSSYCGLLLLLTLSFTSLVRTHETVYLVLLVLYFTSIKINNINILLSTTCLLWHYVTEKVLILNRCKSSANWEWNITQILVEFWTVLYKSFWILTADVTPFCHSNICFGHWYFYAYHNRKPLRHGCIQRHSESTIGHSVHRERNISIWAKKSVLGLIKFWKC